MEQQIALTAIKDNPYQPRTIDDAEHIEKLARSIAADSLLQKPTARQMPDGSVQLAFGHSRRKAFEWLNANYKQAGLADRYNGYIYMPIDIEELTDQEIYRFAVTENVQRKDLAPTELAKSMKRYMDEFKASSKDAGELFGMSDATVRGMVRLLELPENVQTALDSGTISQGTARLFHSMQKIASPEIIEKTLKRIDREAGKSMPEAVIEREIDHLDSTVELWSDGNQNGKPRAGWRGWPLDMKRFPNDLLPRMSEQGAAKYESQLEHLNNPPACNACPFYTQIRGTHYCGLKICYERKYIAWELHLLNQASKNLNIPIYNKGEDGGYVLLVGYENSHKKIFADHHAGLRLLPRSAADRYASQWGFDGVNGDHLLVVATGQAVDKLDKTSRGRSKGGKKTEKEKAEMRMMRIYRIRRKELMWEFTAAAKSIFDGVPIKALRKLNNWRSIGIDDRIPDEWLEGKKATAETEADFE